MHLAVEGIVPKGFAGRNILDTQRPQDRKSKLLRKPLLALVSHLPAVLPSCEYGLLLFASSAMLRELLL